MQTEKKTFTKAEAEVIRFEKNDVITTSGEGPWGTGPVLEVGEEEDE